MHGAKPPSRHARFIVGQARLATGDVVANAGAMNPQIRFGEDLMSRVSYVMMNPGGGDELTSAVRGALDTLIEDLCNDLDTDLLPDSVRTHIHDVVLVGAR